MTDARLPPLERLLLRLFVRGPGAEVVRGDITELYREDLERSTPARARRRLRRQVLASCVAWWRPGAWRARRAGRGDDGGTFGDRVPRDLNGAGGARGGVEMGMWIQDLGIAGRSLGRRPGFALGVAVTLGLGIGATTTIFSVVDGVLLRPLPFEDPGRLVAVGATFPNREWADQEAGLQHLAGISMLNFRDYAERSRSFERLAGIEVSSSVLLADRGDGPELVPVAAVSGDLFTILAVTPALGRTFLPEEHGEAGADVAMLTHAAWLRRYGGDPDVIGGDPAEAGAGLTIVGALPPDFVPPEAFFSSAPDFWLPLNPDDPRYGDRGRRSLYALGRLAPSVTAEVARAEARAIAADLAVEFPDGNVNVDGSHLGIGVNGLLDQTVGTTGRTLRLFLAAAGMLLLLAAMNAATLLLARSLDRVREMGVRTALGASRARMMRLILTEAGLLATAGGAIGVAIAFAGVETFLRFVPPAIPRTDAVVLDGRVLAVAIVVSLGAGLAAGLLPALRSTRRGPWEPLKGAGRGGTSGTSRLRGALVAGQMSVAVVLLSGAALLFTSFVRISTVEPGFEPEGLVTLNVPVKRPEAPEGERSWQAWDLVLAEVAGVPGVESIAGATNVPYQSPNWAPRLLLSGDPPETIREGIAGYAVTPTWFETAGTELLDGRGIERLDGPDAERVAVVNEEFVRTQLSGDDPLGLVIRHAAGGEEEEIRIVGVVENVVQGRAQEGVRPAIYVPYTQSEWPWIQVAVRTSLPTESIVPALREAVGRFSSIVPVRDLRTMDDRISATRTTPRFQTILIGAFALVALLLAAAGLYGSLSHAVGRRQRELGVRMALGAARRSVLGLVLRQGMRASVTGLVIGLVLTLAFAGALTDFLFEVEPHDPVTLALASLVLLAVAAAACVVPARRATTVQPVEVLRSE